MFREMGLSSSNIKEFHIFSYILGNGHFQPKLEKMKKIHLEKISHTSRKCTFLTPILKNFLYFFKRNLFLYFGKRKPRKKSLYFRKQKLFSYTLPFYFFNLQRDFVTIMIILLLCFFFFLRKNLAAFTSFLL